MDERTLTSAEVETERQRQRAIDSLNAMKTYQVVVLGAESAPEWFTIPAHNAEDRVAKMSAEGIDLIKDDWAAGYLDASRQPQVCGNNDEAKSLVRLHLRKR